MTKRVCPLGCQEFNPDQPEVHDSGVGHREATQGVAIRKPVVAVSWELVA